MRAYEFFRQEEQVRTIRLATSIDNSAFDDAVCQDQGLESELLPWGVQGKKVYLAPGGRFFCRGRTDGTWIRMNSLNLSWVPLSLFPTVLHHFETRHQGPAYRPMRRAPAPSRRRRHPSPSLWNVPRADSAVSFAGPLPVARQAPKPRLARRSRAKSANELAEIGAEHIPILTVSSAAVAQTNSE